MTFAAKSLATQPVTELVNDLYEAERYPHVKQRAEPEEILIRRQPVPENLELERDESDGGQHENDADKQKRVREDPARVAKEPVEQPVGIKERDLDVEDVRDRREPSERT